MDSQTVLKYVLVSRTLGIFYQLKLLESLPTPQNTHYIHITATTAVAPTSYHSPHSYHENTNHSCKINLYNNLAQKILQI